MRHIDLIVVHRNENGHTGRELVLQGQAEYNLFIRKDGTVDVVVPLEYRAAHAVGYNSRSVGIAVYGCFMDELDGRKCFNAHPTQAQLDSLDLVILGLQWWLGTKLAVNGHTELPGASRDPKKVCPGPNLDLNAVRRRTGTKGL